MPSQHPSSPSPADLRAFVQGQNADILADRLWRWALRDPDLMRNVEVWFEQAHAQGCPSALRSVIAGLMHEPLGYLDEDDTSAYVERAGEIFALLDPWLEKDPAQLRELCEFALERLYEVVEIADDSNGELGDFQDNLIHFLMDALAAAPPAADWLDRWFGLMASDPMGVWDEAAILKVAGSPVRALYGERATQAWQDWLAHDQPAPPHGHDAQRERLRRRYLNFVELQGDAHAVHAAMSASASTSGDYIQLTQFCETQQWHDKAAQCAQAAYAKFPQDWRIESDWLRCCERDGLHEEAIRLRRKLLEKSPTVEAYQAVLQAARQAGREESAYRDELFAWAKAQELLPRSNHGGTGDRPNVSTRLAWLLAEQRLEEAINLVQPPNRCDDALALRLALALPAPRHAHAILLLQRLFNAAMQGAKSPYTHELALVRHAHARMSEAQSREWLAYLRAQHKAKRNFIKELPAS